MRNLILTIGLSVAVSLSFGGSAFGQGASTNSYQGLGPSGPLTLANQPAGIGGSLPYYQRFNPNLSLGTNSLGVPTNQVMGVTTNTFQPTNTAFNCSDYENVGFQLTGYNSNAVYGHVVTIELAFSDDLANFDVIQDPILIGLPTNAGYFSLVTNIPTPSQAEIYVVNEQSPTANSTTYLTNQVALFTGKSARKHVNTTAN